MLLNSVTLPTLNQAPLALFATWGLHIDIQTKGLYFPDSGLATCAFSIRDHDSGDLIAHDQAPCPAPNNSVAEYWAILAALECVNRDHHMAHARIICSSESVVSQINLRSYASITRNRLLTALLWRIRQLLDETGANVEYAPIAHTVEAKELARAVKRQVEAGVWR